MKTRKKSTSSKLAIADPTTSSMSKPGVTIIVPCFNEDSVLPYLRDRLRSVKRFLERKYDVYFLLLDDGSTDHTWRTMERLFGGMPDCTIIRQTKNLGVAATILAGIRTAKTEIVCSIDCDCSYDPHELGNMIPMLTTGIDLVTGSPYHPLGKVVSVPGWRLTLSKTASSLYRQVLRRKLYTYTSCFRVYRRSAIINLDLRRNGFLGVAELIGKMDLQDCAIVECPTTLKARTRGVSKMRTARVLVGHLFLLGQLWAIRGYRNLRTPVHRIGT